MAGPLKATPAARNPSAERARERDPRRILVVDDEPAIRRIVSRLLTESGYDVHEASNGAEALAIVQAAPDLLDLVVSDIIMPHLNGIELLESLVSVCPGLPCILITGFAPDELTARGLTAPCGVLTKPLREDTFLAEVRRCLGQRH